MLTYGIPPEFAATSIYETAIRHRVSPEFIGSRNCVTMALNAESRRHRASKPQGSSERVLPSQVTMDQLICASLSHTHYWYEVGMLKTPADDYTYINRTSVDKICVREQNERQKYQKCDEYYNNVICNM